MSIGMGIGMGIVWIFAAARASDHDDDKTVIYVTRHADDAVQLVDLGGGLFQQDCNATACCVERRNELGLERSERLAQWFADQGITAELDEVIASHKPRTADTVRQIAVDAGLDLVDGWVDQVPGDGVHNVPSTPPECGEPAYEGSASSFAETSAYLHALPLGRTVLVGAHSTTVTQIMNGFGIATTDPTLFPGTPTKITGFNNLWRIEVDAGGNGTLTDHWLLDFGLDATTHDRPAGGDGDGDDDDDHDDDHGNHGH